MLSLLNDFNSYISKRSQGIKKLQRLTKILNQVFMVQIISPLSEIGIVEAILAIRR